MADVQHKVSKYKAYLETHKDGDKVSYIFSKLERMPITVYVLQSTGIGKVVNSFRKREGDIGILAKSIVNNWKAIVAEEALRLEAENEANQASNQSEEDSDGKGSPANERQEDSEEEARYRCLSEDSDRNSESSGEEERQKINHHRNRQSKSGQGHRHGERSGHLPKKRTRDEQDYKRHPGRDSDSDMRNESRSRQSEKSQKSADMKNQTKLSGSHSENSIHCSKDTNYKKHSGNRESDSKSKYSDEQDGSFDIDSFDIYAQSESEHENDTSHTSKQKVQSSHQQDSKHKDTNLFEEWDLITKERHSEKSTKEVSKHGGSSSKGVSGESKSRTTNKDRDKRGHSKENYSRSKDSSREKSRSQEKGSRSPRSNSLVKDLTDVKSSPRKEESSKVQKSEERSKSHKSLASADRSKQEKSDKSKTSEKQHRDSSEQMNSVHSKHDHSSKHKHDHSSKHKHDHSSKQKHDHESKHKSEHDRKHSNNVDLGKHDQRDKHKHDYDKGVKHKHDSDKKDDQSGHRSKQKHDHDNKARNSDDNKKSDHSKVDHKSNHKHDHNSKAKQKDDVNQKSDQDKCDHKSKQKHNHDSKAKHSDDTRKESDHDKHDHKSKHKHDHDSKAKKGEEIIKKDAQDKVDHGKKENKEKDDHDRKKSKKSRRSSQQAKGLSFEDCLFANDSAKVSNVMAKKPKDMGYEQLKNKFKIKKKGSISQELSDVKGKSNVLSLKRKAEEDILSVPSPSKQVKLSEVDIMGALPETSANYRPWRVNPLDEKKNFDSALDFDESLIGTKSYARTQIYSGKKQNYVPEVYTLQDICLQSLMNNIDHLEYVGGVPFYILKPVLEKCTSTQLFRLEDFNPQFISDSDDLWKLHCDKDFKGVEPDEFESWRELYLRKYDEREEKLKSIRNNISTSMAKAKPVRTTKLAYIDSMVKPPREVRRQQIKFGTAGSSSGERSRKFAHAMDPIAINRERREEKVVKQMAPMMQRTMKMIKKMRR